jgi:hypothetical protein
MRVLRGGQEGIRSPASRSRIAKWFVGAGTGIGVEFGCCGLPAGASGTLPSAGISRDGGVAALDGGTGVRGSGGPEALRASEIPPWAAIDNTTDNTQNPMVFIAPLFTSQPRGHDVCTPRHRVKYCRSRAIRRQGNCRPSRYAVPCVVAHTANPPVSVRNRTEPASYSA